MVTANGNKSIKFVHPRSIREKKNKQKWFRKTVETGEKLGKEKEAGKKDLQLYKIHKPEKYTHH